MYVCLWIFANFSADPRGAEWDTQREREWNKKRKCLLIFYSLPRARAGPETKKCSLFFYFLLLWTLDHLMCIHRHILFPNRWACIVCFSSSNVRALDCNTRFDSLYLVHRMSTLSLLLCVCVYVSCIFFFIYIFPLFRLTFRAYEWHRGLWMRILLPIWNSNM